MKRQKNIFVKKVIKKIDKEEPITAKQYEMMGYTTLALGVLLSGLSIINQKEVNDLSIIFPLIFSSASYPMFRAADEIRNENVKKILMKNIGAKNEYRKK